MPRLKHRSPKMTRNRNTAIVCIDGQTIRLGRWGSDEADEAYRRIIAEWMTNGRRLPPPEDEDEPVPGEGRKVTPVSREHVRRVRPYLSRQVRALIALQLLTGSRADELVRLRAVDIDTSGAVWTVTYDGSTDDQSHKTAHHGKERVIYFGKRAQRVLRLFMVPGRDINRPLFSPRDAEAERYAKCKWHGNGRRKPAKTDRTLRDAYCTTTYRNAIYSACDKAGIPKWSPHRLRHAAGSIIRENFSLEHAQAVLGHSSLKMAEHYARVSEKRAMEVVNKIG